MGELMWRALLLILCFTAPSTLQPAHANEVEIRKFNQSIVGRPNYIWLRMQWLYDDLVELEADPFYLVARRLEATGFFKSIVTENPPYAEREAYWNNVAAENKRNCDEQTKAAAGKKNAFGMPQLVICTGMNRNQLGEDKIFRWIVTFASIDYSKNLKSDGIFAQFEIGIIDEVKVISVAQSSRQGCDWDAHTRTWLRKQVSVNPVLSAVEFVTGRDSLDQDNCYFMDRDGLRWRIANAMLH